MPLNLSIKGVPDAVAERLRARAERNHRSLQGELMAIVSEAVAGEPPIRVGRSAEAPDSGVSVGWKTIEQTIAEMQSAARRHPPRGIPLAVDIIRADRDSR